MKSCRKYREALLWQTINEADPAMDTALQEHLQSCSDCRAHASDVHNAVDRLRNAEPDSTLEPVASLHYRIVKAVHRTPIRPAGEGWPMALGFPQAIAVLAAAVGLAFLGALLLKHPSVPVASRPGPLPVHFAAAAELAPTLANYQGMANRSLEAFDEALSTQARRSGSHPHDDKAGSVAGLD